MISNHATTIDRRDKFKARKNSIFFIFGGLIIPVDEINSLHNEINEIRANFGYNATDELKFETNARPEQITVETAKEAKKQVITAAQKSNCKFIVHIIHHDIIANQDQHQQVMWAADYVIGRFNYYLKTKNDTGICVVDNMPIGTHQSKYLSDKFTQGLSFPNGNKVALENIRLFAVSYAGASLINSAMDIVLGAFRYCLNNPKNQETASKIMQNIVPLMWHEREGTNLLLKDSGLRIYLLNIVVIMIICSA